MVSKTNEAALKPHIENTFTKGGYRVGYLADFDSAFAFEGNIEGSI